MFHSPTTSHQMNVDWWNKDSCRLVARLHTRFNWIVHCDKHFLQYQYLLPKREQIFSFFFLFFFFLVEWDRCMPKFAEVQEQVQRQYCNMVKLGQEEGWQELFLSYLTIEFFWEDLTGISSTFWETIKPSNSWVHYGLIKILKWGFFE